MAVHGSKAFKAATGANAVELRALELLQVVTPERTESNHRIFSDADLQRAKEWLLAHRQPARAPTPNSTLDTWSRLAGST